VLAGELDVFRSVVADLAAELDPMDVAAAAVKMAHEASHAEAEAHAEEQDIRAFRRRATASRSTSVRLGQAARAGCGRPPDEPAVRRRDEPGRAPGGRAARAPAWETVRIFVGAGRLDALKPGDLVGAIANEAGLPAARSGRSRSRTASRSSKSPPIARTASSGRCAARRSAGAR
jgi:ATP-dependent RNA helicase DeaD